MLRGLLSAHSKTPLEALHLETNCLPVRYILKSCRLVYLQTILQKESTELVRKVYEAQKADPSPKDLYVLVSDDCRAIGLNMCNGDIAKLTKQKFKDIVKAKVRNAALQYLNQLKQSHSKMDQLKYDKLEVQQYLTSPLFNNESRTLLLRLRTRKVNGIRADFRGLY